MKETQEIKEYRHEVANKIYDVMHYLSSAVVDDKTEQFTPQEIEALRIGGCAALSCVADIMPGGLDIFIRPELVEYGMNDSPKGLAKHIIEAATLTHKHFVINKE